MGIKSMGSSSTRRGDYGFDAPYGPILMTIAGLGVLSLAVSAAMSPEMKPGPRMIKMIGGFVSGTWLLFSAAVFIHTTRKGKFAVWSELLDQLELRGNERLLDIGCGRGAVLLMAAERLPQGRAVGIDLWSKKDQSGNAEQVTRRNAELEGVAERIELHTGDMRQLPFEDGSFDVVVSSLAIHNVPSAADRAKALREAARVMKSGAKLLIADVAYTGVYAKELEASGLKITERRSLGPRFWYGGGPWMATRLVAGEKV